MIAEKPCMFFVGDGHSVITQRIFLLQKRRQQRFFEVFTVGSGIRSIVY